MYVETERTPNPAALKFIPDQPVLETGTLYLSSVDEADKSPLAKRIFHVDGVESVMLAQGFLSVTLADGEWYDKKPEVLSAIMEHYMSNDPVVHADMIAVEDDSDPETVQQIKAILDEKVRPAVAQDGGDIIFDSFREGIVYLRMQGACAGCPSSTATLKHGVENLLKYYVPEVVGVEQVPIEGY